MTTGKKRILLVDDSEVLRIRLRTLLETKGYEVIEAFDGKVGLRKMEEIKEVDLIISDFNMPEMDGMTMCYNIRQFHKTVPMFMLTTETTKELRDLGKSVGITAWIVKPFNDDKIIVGIERVLSRTVKK